MSRWSWFLQVLRRIAGAPDYTTYLEHCRRAGHPPTLSEGDYIRECFDRKGTNARCC